MIALAFAAALLATPYERAPLTHGDFVWLERPAAEDLSFSPPTTAQADEVFVLLLCEVGPDGRLARCRVETTTGRDNGEVAASLRVANKFRMASRTKAGEPTAGRKVRVPMRWMPPE